MRETSSVLFYVAGPFRGPTAWDVECNIRTAEWVGWTIADLGGTPVIPHAMYRFFDGQFTDQFWLDATMDLLRRCDAIVLCDGWEESSGACAEREEAQRLAMRIYEQDNTEGIRRLIAEKRSGAMTTTTVVCDNRAMERRDR